MIARLHVPCRTVCSAVLREGARQVGISRLPGETINRLKGWYLWRLGDRIFRHTALEWVADWARRNNRRLRLYGKGWEHHPTLSEFAAGPANNGRELLCVYRASRINLQIMPAGFIHQRALDGLSAGGFFLTRLVPGDLRGKVLRQLAERIRSLGITQTRTLLEHSDAELRKLSAEVCGERLSLIDPADNGFLLDLLVASELPYPDDVFPEFHEIAFDSPQSFADAADRFLANDSKRRKITTEMRQVVVDRFGYRTAMEQFLGAMSGHLACQATK